MDQFELNKIAGAVLCALIAIVLPKTLIEMSAETAAHSKTSASAGYELPVAGATAAKGGTAPVLLAGAPATAVAANIFATVKPLLAAAKPEGGAATFKSCAACHSAEKGGANKIGPALWGIVGRKSAAVEGFNYSESLKGKGGEWTYENLAAFINNPKGYAAGTKMVYSGLADAEKLADVLAYLATLSDAPVALPK